MEIVEICLNHFFKHKHITTSFWDKIHIVSFSFIYWSISNDDRVVQRCFSMSSTKVDRPFLLCIGNSNVAKRYSSITIFWVDSTSRQIRMQYFSSSEKSSHVLLCKIEWRQKTVTLKSVYFPFFDWTTQFSSHSSSTIQCWWINAQDDEQCRKNFHINSII